MRCIRVLDREFRLDRQPLPSVGDGDVLVQVQYAAINGIDVVRARTAAAVPPGIEFAGRVVECGTGAQTFSPGDEVMGLSAGGAFSEYVALPQELLVRRPDWMDPKRAAAFCEMFIIAYDAIQTVGLADGRDALVRGALGVVGNGIVQLLQGLGVSVTGIGRSLKSGMPQPDRLFLDGGAGLDPGSMFDAVFECVGPSHLDQDVELLRAGGQVLLLGGMGALVTEVDFLAVMQKRVSIRGSTFSSRPDDQKAAIMRRAADDLLPQLHQGKLAVPVDNTYALDDYAEALQRFSSGSAVGKVLIRFS